MDHTYQYARMSTAQVVISVSNQYKNLWLQQYLIIFSLTYHILLLFITNCHAPYQIS